MNARTDPQQLQSARLEDRYELGEGTVFLSGNQALVRIALDQRRIDERQGHQTGGFISGYRGSPLGRLDMELWQVQPLLRAANVHFQPGVNEDLAATAVWGSQYVGTFPGATVQGVFGIWYGKGPGVDRSGDPLKHGNLAGTSALGGVLVLAGEPTHETVAAARDNGASGFISKGEPPDRLAQAIEACLARPDEFLLRAALPPASDRAAVPPAPQLIPRLWQVFALVAEGKPNKVIARELGVTEGAVKNYVTRVLEATGTSNRGEAIKLYIENIERWRADPRSRDALRASG